MIRENVIRDINPDMEQINMKPANQYSVDCTNANTGLFTGIFVLVITIISLILFLVLINSPREDLHDAAITVASITEVSLYTLTTFAALIGIFQVIYTSI